MLDIVIPFALSVGAVVGLTALGKKSGETQAQSSPNILSTLSNVLRRVEIRLFENESSEFFAKELQALRLAENNLLGAIEFHDKKPEEAVVMEACDHLHVSVDAFATALRSSPPHPTDFSENFAGAARLIKLAHPCVEKKENKDQLKRWIEEMHDAHDIAAAQQELSRNSAAKLMTDPEGQICIQRDPHSPMIPLREWVNSYPAEQRETGLRFEAEEGK